MDGEDEAMNSLLYKNVWIKITLYIVALRGQKAKLSDEIVYQSSGGLFNAIVVIIAF